jgi:uncharacterized membrane protein
MPRGTRGAQPGSAGGGGAVSSVRLAHKATFRKEGEYWTVGRVGKSFRLKDTKGLRYLAHLLRHPQDEFHVLDLAGGIAGHREDDEPGQAQSLPRGVQDLEKAGIHIGSLGDAGEMLDEQAKAAYRRRLSELREELEEAKELGKVERAEQAEQEIDALTRELSRAVGLGGRNRRAASASERARQNITKAIRAVVERIVENDALLGDIFSRCIKTGTFCSYQPDPDFPIAWEFAATDSDITIEPTEQQLSSSGAPAPARTDHRQAAPVVLEVSPFSLAERIAFVGRETEVSRIRAVIDRPLTRHGSLVMLWDGSGVGKRQTVLAVISAPHRQRMHASVAEAIGESIPMPLKSAPGRSVTIFSRLERLLTSTN